MPSRSYSIAESKNRLPAIIHEVEKNDPVFIHRRGKAVAVLLSVDSYERLKSGTRMGFFQSYDQFRAKCKNQSYSCLETADFEGLRDQSPGRQTSL